MKRPAKNEHGLYLFNGYYRGMEMSEFICSFCGCDFDGGLHTCDECEENQNAEDDALIRDNKKLEAKLKSAIEVIRLIAHNGYEDKEMKVDIIPEEKARQWLRDNNENNQS